MSVCLVEGAGGARAGRRGPFPPRLWGWRTRRWLCKQRARAEGTVGPEQALLLPTPSSLGLHSPIAGGVRLGARNPEGIWVRERRVEPLPPPAAQPFLNRLGRPPRHSPAASARSAHRGQREREQGAGITVPTGKGQPPVTRALSGLGLEGPTHLPTARAKTRGRLPPRPRGGGARGQPGHAQWAGGSGGRRKLSHRTPTPGSNYLSQARGPLVPGANLTPSSVQDILLNFIYSCYPVKDTFQMYLD